MPLNDNAPSGSGGTIYGLFANMPPVTNVPDGQVYVCTDSGTEYQSENGAWVVLPSSGGTPNVIEPGNLGSTYTLNLSANTPQWLEGTLNANLALTVNLMPGASALLFLTQDGTGSRTLTINSTAVTITSTASTTSVVQLNSDGTNLFVSVI